MDVNCDGSWGSWTPCVTDSSHDCSDGKIGAETTRQFNSRVSAQYGGIACPSKQTSNCPITNAHCADIDCEVNWGSWTPCATDNSHDCSDGKMGAETTQSYTITTSNQFGGAACPPTRTSNCPTTNDHCSGINCEVNWGSWTPCATDSSHDCSDGKMGARMTQSYTITTSNQFGGAACPPTRTSNCPTTNDHCSGINCEVNWGSWTPCATDSSHDCSDGKMGARMTQSYTITTSNQFGGASCPPTRTSNCPITNEHCSGINCEVNWGSWTPCAIDSSHDCSDGKMGARMTQSYTITASNQFGGASCPPTRTSNCPTTNDHCSGINCEVNWGSWTPCATDSSYDCSGGQGAKMTQSYTITTSNQFGGAACPPTRTSNCPATTQHCLRSTPTSTPASTPAPTSSASILVPNSNTITFSINNSQGTPNRFGTSFNHTTDINAGSPTFKKGVHLLTKNLFVLAYSIMQSGVERNALFVYDINGNYYSQYVFPGNYVSSQKTYCISEQKIIVERNKELHLLELSSSNKISLVNTLDVSSSFNSINVSNSNHFQVINLPVNNYFGLFYSWNACPLSPYDNCNPRPRPLSYKYFVIHCDSNQYVVEGSKEDNISWVENPENSSIANYRIRFVNPFGYYGIAIMTYSSSDKPWSRISMITFDNTSKSFTSSEVRYYPQCTRRCYGMHFYGDGVNIPENNLFVIKMGSNHQVSPNPFSWTVYFINTQTRQLIKQYALNTSRHSSEQDRFNMLSKATQLTRGPNNNEVILSHKSGNNINYSKMNINLSTNAISINNILPGYTFKNTHPIQQYLFNNPYLMVISENNTQLTIKYTIPLPAPATPVPTTPTPTTPAPTTPAPTTPAPTTPTPTTPAPTKPISISTITNDSTVTFSINTSGETPSQFNSVHPFTSNYFIISHSVMKSGVKRNAVFIYNTSGTYYSKYVFSSLPFSGQTIYPISNHVIMVNRNRKLYFLRVSSDFRSLSLENEFDVSSKVNGVGVGKFGNTDHPKFFIINHPINNYFGLFYSWRPAHRQGHPTNNPVKFRYFIFEYTGANTLTSQLKSMYPPSNNASLGHVGGYIGGDQVLANAKYDIIRADSFGSYGAMIHVGYGDGRDGMGFIMLTYDSSTNTINKQVQSKIGTPRWCGPRSVPGVNKNEDNMYVAKWSYCSQGSLSFYDSSNKNLITRKTYNNSNQISSANTLTKGLNKNEVILSKSSSSNLIYYKVNKDTNISTVSPVTVTGPSAIKSYIFNYPYFMIFYGNSGEYTIKYVNPSPEVAITAAPSVPTIASTSATPTPTTPTPTTPAPSSGVGNVGSVTRFTYSGSHVDITPTATGWVDCTLISGSGGRGGRHHHTGGQGVELKAKLYVTSGKAIRIIVGNNASNADRSDRTGGPGGSGTAVLTNDGSGWKPVLVAGGGGGSADRERGGNGGMPNAPNVHGANGGTTSGGGVSHHRGRRSGHNGGNNNPSTGGNGGEGSASHRNHRYTGPFGYGKGGDSWRDNDDGGGGGGGGGYTGGGGGGGYKSGFGGGGGSSFVHSNTNIVKFTSWKNVAINTTTLVKFG